MGGGEGGGAFRQSDWQDQTCNKVIISARNKETCKGKELLSIV